jgi:hypothetical protein
MINHWTCNLGINKQEETHNSLDESFLPEGKENFNFIGDSRDVRRCQKIQHRLRPHKTNQTTHSQQNHATLKPDEILCTVKLSDKR